MAGLFLPGNDTVAAEARAGDVVTVVVCVGVREKFVVGAARLIHNISYFPPRAVGLELTPGGVRPA